MSLFIKDKSSMNLSIRLYKGQNTHIFTWSRGILNYNTDRSSYEDRVFMLSLSEAMEEIRLFAEEADRKYFKPF
jgi:hypothetical protein